MTTLTDIKQYVRVHLDVDSEELPDLLLEEWARDAFLRIQTARSKWPFWEMTWTLAVSAGVDEYDWTSLGTSEVNRPEQLNQLILADDIYRPLKQISKETAVRRFASDTTGTPAYWRVEHETLFLYPIPSQAYTLTVEGYRAPADWVSGENGGTVDMPVEMHPLINDWVLGRAYMHQDDPDMGAMYVDMADEKLRRFVRRAPGGRHGGPLTLNGGTAARPLTLRERMGLE